MLGLGPTQRQSHQSPQSQKKVMGNKKVETVGVIRNLNGK